MKLLDHQDVGWRVMQPKRDGDAHSTDFLTWTLGSFEQGILIGATHRPVANQPKALVELSINLNGKIVLIGLRDREHFISAHHWIFKKAEI